MSQRAAGYGSASRYDSAADVRPLHRQQRRRSARGSQAGLTSSQPEPRIGSPPLLGEQIFDLLQRLPPPAEWPSALLSYLVIDPLLAVTRISIDVLVSPRTHRIVLRLGVLTTLFWTGLFLAIAAYVGFYRAWVPDIGLTRAVWLQYGQSSPPYADIDLRTRTESGMGVFAPEQEYDISLDLVVPLSAANLDLGNFMIALELRSPLNQTVYHISKPSIIVHEPAPLRAMNNIVFQLTRNAPAVILPTSSPPVQLMTIQLLRRAVLQPAHPAHPFAASVPGSISRAVVTVGRYDADKYWKYGGGHGVGGIVHEGSGILKAAAGVEGFRSRGELQTHSASLRFDAHLTGLRYFMYHHPLASFFIFTILFMGFEMISALTLWAFAAYYTSSLTQPSLEIEDNFLGAPLRRRGDGTDDHTATDTDGPAPYPGAADETYESDTVTEGESELEDEGRNRDAALTPGAGSESDALTPRQRQSLASLQAQEAQERWEQRRAAMLREEDDGQFLTPIEHPSAGGSFDDLGVLTDQPRRVLGRLDEETEEDTDVRSNATSAGWEDVGDDDALGAGFYGRPIPSEYQTAGELGQEGLRQRRRPIKEEPYEEGGYYEDDEEEDDDRRRRAQRESTVGGSSTSRASTAPTLGMSSRAGSSTPSTSAGPSRATAEASSAPIKEESEETEPETDDSDEKGPAAGRSGGGGSRSGGMPEEGTRGGGSTDDTSDTTA